MSPGLWWIARNNAISDQLFDGSFEQNERIFVGRFVRPGMTVVDIGANAGLYTIIAAKRVGPSGRIVAFEPSPREQRWLRTHLRINRCANVRIEEVALGDAPGQADLFIVEGQETGCNSMRPADLTGTARITVPVRTLDDYYAHGQLARVDLIKMDIEGAELSALRGAARVFKELRPALLCEIEEARIEPWNYRGADIVRLVAGWAYRWFAFAPGGALVPLAPSLERFSGNFVALPEESSEVKSPPAPLN